MTVQEFNTMDKVLGSNPVEKLSKQATESIEQAKQQKVNLPQMPDAYTPFMQNPQAQESFLLAIDGQQKGPYTAQQLRQFLAEGSITVETLLWKSGLTEWTPIKDYPGLI